MAEDVIKAVVNAMELLDILKSSKEPQTIHELAAAAGISQTSAHRIIKTLEGAGWVITPARDMYRVGRRVELIMGHEHLYTALADAAKASLDRYAQQCMTAMSVMVFENTYCNILQQSATEEAYSYVPPIGTRIPFHACACGKILAALLPEARRNDLLDFASLVPMTKNTICSREELSGILKKAADLGYATDMCETLEIGSCIAVPIRDNEGTAIAALSCSGILGVTDRKDLLKYLPALHEASNDISHRLFRFWPNLVSQAEQESAEKS